MKERNRETNSYFTEKELDILTEKYGFTWNNRSNAKSEQAMDNYYYSAFNSFSITVRATQESFTLYIDEASYFSPDEIFLFDLTFNDVIEKLDFYQNKKNSFIFELSFRLSLIFVFFLSLFSFPFYLKANKKYYSRENFTFFQTVKSFSSEVNQLNPFIKLDYYAIQSYSIPVMIVMGGVFTFSLGIAVSKYLF
jgi:hypothetical protein